MSGIRKPKDLGRYAPAKQAAEELRQFAASLDGERDGVLIKWDLQVRRWHPDWEARPHIVVATKAGR